MLSLLLSSTSHLYVDRVPYGVLSLQKTSGRGRTDDSNIMTQLSQSIMFYVLIAFYKIWCNSVSLSHIRLDLIYISKDKKERQNNWLYDHIRESTNMIKHRYQLRWTQRALAEACARCAQHIWWRKRRKRKEEIYIHIWICLRREAL